MTAWNQYLSKEKGASPLSSRRPRAVSNPPAPHPAPVHCPSNRAIELTAASPRRAPPARQSGPARAASTPAPGAPNSTFIRRLGRNTTATPEWSSYSTTAANRHARKSTGRSPPPPACPRRSSAPAAEAISATRDAAPSRRHRLTRLDHHRIGPAVYLAGRSGRGSTHRLGRCATRACLGVRGCACRQLPARYPERRGRRAPRAGHHPRLLRALQRRRD